MDFDELKKHIKIIVQIYKKNERDPYMALWIRRLMMIILLVSAFMVYALGMTKAVLVIAVVYSKEIGVRLDSFPFSNT